VNGLVLCPALALEAFSQYRTARRIRFRWLWIALVPLGFVAYLFLNYKVTGDFFAFSQIQEEHWYKKLTPPWVGIRELWLRTLGENPIEGLHEFFYIILGIAGMIWCWLRTRPSYAMWVTGNLLLVTQHNFHSECAALHAHSLSIFHSRRTRLPRSAAASRLCHSLSLLSLALYAGRFARGIWAF